MIQQLNLVGNANTKSVTTPGIKDKQVDESGDELLSAKDATHYRSLVMRIAYLAQDRADLQFAAKECARGMSKPTRGDQLKLKRIGRYLKGRPRAVIVFNTTAGQLR